MAAPASTRFSPLQLELLKVFSFNPTEEELRQVKVMLTKFFAKKLAERVALAAEQKGITDADLDAWLNEPEQ